VSARPALVVDLSALEGADIGLVDALARLSLEARRQGACIRVVGAPSGLTELAALTGLTDALGLEPASGGQPVGQPEEREEARGIEEEGHRGDPVA
jgi:anti-anti-sigma regulatory factor